ncbi:MAG: GNAT family N-acetyltransferase [Defluviitaleaceae bacterium]|nr:GNAT family N-acetyltransferase [Defluviitaleaceae bacterium]
MKGVVIIINLSINTQRLFLRTTTQEDLDAVASIWGDIEGGKYMPDPNYKSGNEIAEILEDDPDCPVYYLVAFRTGYDEVVGTCSLGFENADANEYSIGYNVKKDYWGNGYAGEMVHALIDFARELGIKSITAPVAKANKASNRVMEKCGFFIDGESSFKKSGTAIVHPTFIYRLDL